MRPSEIAKRLTGISTPFGGVSWVAPEAEVAVARRVIRFLEDRRVLYNPSELEQPGPRRRRRVRRGRLPRSPVGRNGAHPATGRGTNTAGRGHDAHHRRRGGLQVRFRGSATPAVLSSQRIENSNSEKHQPPCEGQCRSNRCGGYGVSMTMKDSD